MGHPRFVAGVGNRVVQRFDKLEGGALSAAYPTQAQKQGLNGAPQPLLPVQETGSSLSQLAPRVGCFHGKLKESFWLAFAAGNKGVAGDDVTSCTLRVLGDPDPRCDQHFLGHEAVILNLQI
jgi:hypothetical protein